MTKPIDLKPDDSPKKSGGRSCLTVIALFLVYLLLSAMLLVLPTGFIGPVFALGGLILVGVIGFHYIVWGRWMSQVVQEEAEEELAFRAETDTMPHAASPALDELNDEEQPPKDGHKSR